MVFLIEDSRNRDSAAIHVKSDELIRTGAVQNSFVGIEHLSANELEALRARCEERAKAVAAERKAAREGAHAGPRTTLTANSPAQRKTTSPPTVGTREATRRSS